MEKFLIWKAKNSSFTKNFGQNIRFVPYDTIATSEHTVTDIQVAPFRGCLLLRLTDYLYDPNDESVRKILNITYQKIDSAIAYQDTDGKVKIASEGYNCKYFGDAVEIKDLVLDWFDFEASEFTTKAIDDQNEDEDSSNETEDENDSISEDEVAEENVDSDDENQEADEEAEPVEKESEEEESDDEVNEELPSSIENESDVEDANSDVQHELHENEDVTEVESWSTADDDEKEEETPKVIDETDTTANEEKAKVAANKYRLNQEPTPKFNKNKKNKKNFKPKNRMNNSTRPYNNKPVDKPSTTIPLHNPVNRNSELLKKLMGL